jgi:hypothetical protein
MSTAMEIVFIVCAIAALTGLFIIVRLLTQLAEGTDRIAEIMRRSHAADLDRYDERLRTGGDGSIAETPLYGETPAHKFQTMSG